MYCLFAGRCLNTFDPMRTMFARCQDRAVPCPRIDMSRRRIEIADADRADSLFS